jgi:hypothetical protein
MAGSIMGYRVVCPACNDSFPSYEKFIGHVFKAHENEPALRMKAKVVHD